MTAPTEHDNASTPTPVFTQAEAERHLFPPPARTIVVGGRPIPVKPLNAHGVMTVFALVRDLARPAFDAYRAYRKERDAYIAALASGCEDVEQPFPFFFLDVLADKRNLDNILLAVTHVLQRGDPSLTLEFVTEHFEPIVQLQELLPIVAESNALTTLLRKLLASELLATVKTTLVSSTSSRGPMRSDSPPSSPTSPGTTGSAPAP